MSVPCATTSTRSPSWSRAIALEAAHAALADLVVGLLAGEVAVGPARVELGDERALGLAEVLLDELVVGGAERHAEVRRR